MSILKMSQFMKMHVLRFFHPSQVASSLAITSSCSGSSQRQSELLALRTCKGGEMPCPCMAWQHQTAVIFLSDCLSQCLWMLLGKKGHLFYRIQVRGGKGTTGRSSKQHSHPSLLPHPSLLAGREAEETVPAVSNAFTGYCSLAAVMYRQLQPTGSQHWEPASAAAKFGPDLRVTSSDSV